MPIHEYRCLDCSRKVSVFFRRLSDVDHTQARCDRCGSARLSRLMSRVRMVRGGTSATDGGGDVDESLLDDAAGIDENDPRAIGRFMRRMADETGEDVGPEFDEIIGRLERGEAPESIERDMGDMLGDSPESDAATDADAPAPAAPSRAARKKAPRKPAAKKKAAPSKRKKA